MSGSRCEQRARALVAQLYDTLRPLGFRKRGTWLRRHRSGSPLGLVGVLGVQLSQGNQGRTCRAYVNVGAGLLGLPTLPLDTERVRPRDCLWSERIGDHWELDDDLHEVAHEVGSAAVAWFEARDSVEALLAPLDERDPSSLGAWLGQVAAVCAAWVARGDTDRARALLLAKRDYLAEHRPKANLGPVDELARALGLEHRSGKWTEHPEV